MQYAVFQFLLLLFSAQRKHDVELAQRLEHEIRLTPPRHQSIHAPICSFSVSSPFIQCSKHPCPEALRSVRITTHQYVEGTCAHTNNISTLEETWFVRIVPVNNVYFRCKIFFFFFESVARLFWTRVSVNTRGYSGVDQSAAEVLDSGSPNKHANGRSTS